jgi:hypothetical protein
MSVAIRNAIGIGKCQPDFRTAGFFCRCHAGLRHFQCADAADGGVHLAYLRRAKGEEEHVSGTGGEIVRASHNVRHQHRLHIFFGQPAGRQDRLDHRIDGAHGREAHHHPLTLEIGHGLHRRVLAHPERAAQGV